MLTSNCLPVASEVRQEASAGVSEDQLEASEDRQEASEGGSEEGLPLGENG